MDWGWWSSYRCGRVSLAVALARAAPYVLTPGTADPDDPEGDDVIPDFTDFVYTLVAYRRYDPQLYAGWYIWHYRSSLVCSNASTHAASSGASGGSGGWR